MAEKKQLDNAVRTFREIALKAYDEKSGAFKAEYDQALDKASADLDKKIDDLRMEVKRAQSSAGNDIERKAQLRKDQSGAFRGILNAMGKGMSVGNDVLTKANEYVRFDAETAGNLLLQPEMVNEINRKAVEISDFLALADVRRIGSSSIKVPVQGTNITAAWEDELQSSANVAEEFDLVTLTPKKLKVLVTFTEEELQDSIASLEPFTFESVSLAMAQKLGTAALTGNSAKQPTGMLGVTESINSTSLTLAANQLIALAGEVKDEYLRANPDKCGWMMTRKTRARVRALSQATNSNLFWEIDGRAGYPERFQGYPIFIAAAGDLAEPTNVAGAYAADGYSVGFGNWFRAYSIAIREEIAILRDPYTLANQDAVRVNFRFRVDGAPTNKEAVKFLKMTNS
jgi:HK97 family phage major capsid protein